MRKNIKMLCVTNWNAVLELKYFYLEHFPGRTYSDKMVVTVADPCAVDAGTDMRLNEIKLVARIKSRK